MDPLVGAIQGHWFYLSPPGLSSRAVAFRLGKEDRWPGREALTGWGRPS